MSRRKFNNEYNVMVEEIWWQVSQASLYQVKVRGGESQLTLLYSRWDHINCVSGCTSPIQSLLEWSGDREDQSDGGLPSNCGVGRGEPTHPTSGPALRLTPRPTTRNHSTLKCCLELRRDWWDISGFHQSQQYQWWIYLWFLKFMFDTKSQNVLVVNTNYLSF